MQPSSKFLPVSSLPRSTSQIDPELTNQPHPQPSPSLPSHDPSFRTAPEEPSQAPAATSSSFDTPPPQDEETEPRPIPPAPPNFAPYFTLLSSSDANTTHHPTVHYIFADDPPDGSAITDAALDLLDPSSEGEADEVEDATTGSRHPSREARERYLLLEMDASGTKVCNAQSLSPDWAVTGAEVGMAPTWEGEGGVGSEVGGRGMLLRVEGVEACGGGKGRVREREKEGQEREFEELVEEYERRMGELRRVVGGGGGGGIGGEDAGT